MILLLTGCVEFFAVQFAPSRVPERAETPEAEAAKQSFWRAFRDNQMTAVPQVTADLTAQSLKHPQDASLARLLGHVHFWWFVERDRMGEIDATITDHAVLSEHYFAQAALLEPEDHRIHAWWGGSQLVVAQLRGDEAAQRTGYFETKRGIDGYPAYNLVTSGFIFGLPPKDSPPFPIAVESMWLALDDCAGSPVDRDAFEVAPIVNRSPLPERSAGEWCWNDAERFPYNQQGILLQLADLLLKNGEVARAKRVLEQLATTPDHATWPQRHLTAERLAQAEAIAAGWKADPEGEGLAYLLTSGHSCTVCHAAQATPSAIEPPPVEPDPDLE